MSAITRSLANIILLVCLFPVDIHAQEPLAYRIFNQHGKASGFKQLVAASEKTEVILFGELHNNPISHWLQLELTSEIHKQVGYNLVMGMEMFEADNQLLIDEYFEGLIAERNFTQEARLWNNYATDYKPLLEYARTNGLALIATNIPRRYAALVNRQGFDGLYELSDDARRYIAPLPLAYDPELPAYQAMLQMGGMGAHVSENFPKAQAIKDATMAHFILRNLAPGQKFIHFHGTFHSDNFEGIVWYLRHRRPAIKLITISSVEQEQLDTLDESHKGKADFIIVIPQNMTKTY
jgi:uncharacterized iron-regulated protein